MHAAFVLLLLLLGPSLVVGIHSAGIMMLDPTVGTGNFTVMSTSVGQMGYYKIDIIFASVSAIGSELQVSADHFPAVKQSGNVNNNIQTGGGFKMSNGGFDPNFVSMHFGQMALCHGSGAGSTCARAPKLAQQSWQWAARYSLVAGCQFIDPRHATTIRMGLLPTARYPNKGTPVTIGWNITFNDCGRAPPCQYDTKSRLQSSGKACTCIVNCGSSTVKVDSGSVDNGSHAGVMLIVAALVLVGGVFGFAVHKYGIDEVKAVLGLGGSQDQSAKSDLLDGHAPGDEYEPPTIYDDAA